MTGAHSDKVGGGTVGGPRPAEPELRLFLFHHAGGSSSVFEGWESRFPAGWDVRALDAPGRGAARSAKPCTTVEELAGYFRDHLSLSFDRPFSFFGHSMGAMVAYELARRLQAEGGPQPNWVGLSACRAPGQPAARGQHGLSNEDLRAWLAAAGGTDQLVLHHPLIWKMLEPLLRADLRVVDSWQPTVDAVPLRGALSVFGAQDDRVLAHEKLIGWQPFTEHYVASRLFRGGHFYLQRQADLIIRWIVADISGSRRVCATPWTSPAKTR
ncbi:Thioesterase [Catenulispora acidiphila DSM 44928]|uniref:Thioesterase n=1 Tax=Catenulispora acidiphila (strain DSM 44928 / JCM 14897 / NBRC 102108 / NRRL B-24433 / ID139908) TaxID=479433 RepID=C7PXB9_CATAD|nr:alpha/beta fold hydrolase [Catenulispora acidiphila]ACU69470.1 Thioesterase [Catenulispora acidiphila DSM 44928]